MNAAAEMLRKIAGELLAVAKDMEARPDPQPGRAEVLRGLADDVEGVASVVNIPVPPSNP